jgi:hypothetical protein
MGLMLEELQKGPAVLRLSYLADLEGEELVEQRMEKMKKEIMRSWKKLSASACGEQRGAEPANACYPLTIEPEVFWRRGSPLPTEEQEVLRKQADMRGPEQVNE